MHQLRCRQSHAPCVNGANAPLLPHPCGASDRDGPAGLHKMRAPRAVSKGDADRALRRRREHGRPAADSGRRLLAAGKVMDLSRRDNRGMMGDCGSPRGSASKKSGFSTDIVPPVIVLNFHLSCLSRRVWPNCHRPGNPAVSFSARGTLWSAKASVCTGTRRRRGVG